MIRNMIFSMGAFLRFFLLGVGIFMTDVFLAMGGTLIEQQEVFLVFLAPRVCFFLTCFHWHLVKIMISFISEK